MSNNIGGIRFCKHCENMMKPSEGTYLTQRRRNLHLFVAAANSENPLIHSPILMII